ncbi:MAG: hypothetical protein Q8O89_05760 [Nanoarchaeota archaeon]|nr:hypothetical protein [Nanoarchaeota archaeon]
MNKKCLMCREEEVKDDYYDFCEKCQKFRDWKYEKRKRNGKKSISVFKKWGYQNEQKKTR